jgi:uncharacterized membrane protein YraQ (UPF0718 family)
MARLIADVEHLLGDFCSDGEVILFHKAPDLKAWWVNQIPDNLVIAVLLGVSVLVDTTLVRVVALLAAIVLIGAMVTRLLDLAFTRFVLTNHRIIRLSGVIRRDHDWMAWNKVTDVSIKRSLTDRFYDTATIRIQSANEQTGLKDMSDVPEPIVFAKLVADLVHSPGHRNSDHIEQVLLAARAKRGRRARDRFRDDLREIWSR